MITLMVLIMNCFLNFPASRGREAFTIRNVHKVTIESSWKNFTNKAFIEIAATPYYNDASISLESLLIGGDPVEIYLRYDRHSEETEFVAEDLEFTGFVKFVSPQNPVKIECEDYSYLLKNKAIDKPVSLRKGTLKQLLGLIVPAEIELVSVDAPIGNYVSKIRTVAQLLEDLKKDYGIVSYFKGKTLYVGEIYSANTTREVVGIYRFGQNVKKDNLTLENRELNPLVIVRSKIKGQKKPIEVRKGFEGGKENILKVDGITDVSVLQSIADRRYELLTSTKLKGKITGFGWPRVAIGDLIRIENGRFVSFSGKEFFIDTVNQEFSAAGWERNVELGKLH